jgi:hypothetical protein
LRRRGFLGRVLYLPTLALSLRQLSLGFNNPGDGLLATVNAVFPKSRRKLPRVIEQSGLITLENGLISRSLALSPDGSLNLMSYKNLKRALIGQLPVNLRISIYKWARPR